MIQPDPHNGLPSASSMQRTLSCPAWLSRSASAQLEAISEKSWTASGTRAHAVLSGDDDEESIEDDDEIALAVGICKMREEMALVAAGFEDPVAYIEQRIFLEDDHGTHVASGQPDRVYIENGRFFISDYKTGRKDAPAPALNAQLIAYAVLVAQEHGITHGTLAIIPAWRPVPVVAEINEEQIRIWRAAILEAISEARGPSPRAEAGQWCDYCPFRPCCPEAWEIVSQASQFNPKDPSMFEDPQSIIANFRTAKHAEGTIKVFMEQIKARLALLPDSIPGLRIGEGSTMKTIPGSLSVFERLTGLYSPASVLSAVKWTPASLAKVLAPGKGQKLAQKGIEEELADIIVQKEKAGSLELQ